MSRQASFHTRYDLDKASKRVVFKSSVDTSECTSTALLSYPEHDLAGDLVIPEGIDFIPHMSSPGVDIEHRRDPAFGDATVGVAVNKSGEYRGRHVVLKCDDGKSRPLPVGTTHFDSANKLQMQAFALVERDVLPDVSLEFVPDMTCAKSLGRSPLEARNAYEFGRVSVVRWTLCAKGVCPSATVLKAVHLDPLRSVLSAGRIGAEPLHPTIKKALSHYLPSRTTTVTSGYTPAETKAMDSYAPPASDAPVDTEAPPEDDSAPALGGVAAMYAKVQALLDCVTQNESDMETSDSPDLRAFMEKIRGKVSAIAEEIKGRADKHDAKLNGEKEEGEEKDDKESDSDDSDDESPDMDTEDDGTLKAVRQPYKPILKACRVQRYSLAEIRKAEEKKTPAAPLGDSPEDIAELEKQIRLYERDKRRYG